MAAKGKAAFKALVVIQDVLIDDFAQLGSECTASGTTEQAANDAASDGTDHSAHRASDGTNHGTEFSASEDACSHAYGPCNGANGAAGTSPIVAGVNASAVAFGTNHDHDEISLSVNVGAITGQTRLQLRSTMVSYLTLSMYLITLVAVNAPATKAIAKAARASRCEVFGNIGLLG
ncbi:MAG: hypothetical protein A2503_17720 [Burkholderiales bacterium RIFOXYD12_FULL_59_19]|nr:MAG: hypothetical protein A2503_17720 [Burkholderiales bacterium RIFOXYD12_FULL_59_19]